VLAQWLKNLGLDQCGDFFIENYIDEDVLADQTLCDLKDLGIALPGHRKQFRRST